MGALEGLFCVLPGDTQRNDHAVLMGIQTLRCASHPQDDNEWIQELVVDAHLQDAVNAASWSDQIATSLSKCTPKLQSELLGKTFMSYFIEWCQETREASCAFVADKTTWLFDDSLHKNPLCATQPVEQRVHVHLLEFDGLSCCFCLTIIS